MSARESPIRRYRIPRGVLAQFVDILWLYDGDVRNHAQERLLPTATTELVIDLRGKMRHSSPATVAGPHSEHSLLETSATVAVIGVHFKVGGAFPFFGVPAGELHNRRVSLGALWGARAASVVEQVLAASTPNAKFDVLERLLLSVAATFSRHRAVAFALHELSSASQSHSIAGLASALGISHRRFLGHFRDEVGMGPKLFTRVQRFQAVVATVHTLHEVDWTEVAMACGYFDQAHFIHDFRGFSGFTPSAYLALKGADRNHVPLPG